MDIEKIAACVLLSGVVAYAVFGGADFGSGIWSGLASGPRAEQQRSALQKALGAVWEANNVWLIFILVVLMAMFPLAFGDLFTALLVPITIGLIGIVFRGASYAFRTFTRETGQPLVSAHGLLFFVASVITPFFFGVALGAAGGGRIKLDEGLVTSSLYSPWLHPFPILFGLTAVAVCAFLTMNFMMTRSDGELREDFRRRGLLSGVVGGVLAVVTLASARWDAPEFWDLWQRSGPEAMSAVALLAGLAALFVLWRRWYPLAPLIGGGAMILLVVTWGVIQYPYLIVPSERIFDAAADHAMIKASLIGLLAGAVILVPSLLLLYLNFVGEKAEESY